VFKYHKNLEGCKLNTFLSITKPLSEINITLSLVYHLTGSVHKAEAKIQYATGKAHHFTDYVVIKGWTFRALPSQFLRPAISFSICSTMCTSRAFCRKWSALLSDFWFIFHLLKDKEMVDSQEM
jgi:hypothetical protein